MRQGQQNRRGRGRGRKVQNNLSRNLESNGPDVKIRGTASHIAEKYAALARDAQSSGDTVAAENYLQHAEHYNRIIMANQQAQQAQQAEQANGASQPRERGNNADASGDDQPQAAIANAEDGAKSEKEPSSEITDDAGLARTMARTATRRSANGSKADAGDDAKPAKASKSKASDEGDQESSKDEAVT